jgi:PAS domain S-box-containing protein
MTLLQEDRVVLDISEAGQKMLGYNKEDYIGKSRIDLIHPDDQKLVEKAFKAVLKHPQSLQAIEYRFKKANGEYTWLGSTFHNLLNEPSIRAVVIHYSEINERKNALELVKSSEEKYRNLFNNNPSSIFIWNPESLAILEVNDAAVKEYGYSMKEFLIMNITDLHELGNYEEIRKLAADLLNNKNFKSNAVWQHKTKLGESRYMDITFQPIDYYGLKASLAIVNNITEQVELEMELSAERLIRQQEITAAVITAQEQEREELGKELHDNINQILATTRLYIEYAQTNEAMRDGLLNNAKDFIVSAVSEIRNLSKSLSPPSLGEVGLLVALEDLFDTIRTINKYVFHTEWKGLDESRISDQLKLTIFRIIQEQLNNIIKHAKAINIWVKIKIQNQRLLISVKDDGQGFNLINKSKGVGLKNISSRAGLHNGTMQMQSEPGKGCELKVSFSL